MGTPITLVNPSFEQPVIAPGTWTEGGVTPGWAGNSGGVWSPRAGEIAAPPPDGNQVGWVDGTRAGTRQIQDTGIPVDWNANYVLTGQACPPTGEACVLTVVIIAYPSEAVIGSLDINFLGSEGWQPFSVSGSGVGVGTVGIKFSAKQGQPNFDTVALSSTPIDPSGNPYPSIPVGAQNSLKALVPQLNSNEVITSSPPTPASGIVLWHVSCASPAFEQSFNPPPGSVQSYVQTQAAWSFCMVYLTQNVTPIVIGTPLVNRYNNDVAAFLHDLLINQLGMAPVVGV